MRVRRGLVAGVAQVLLLVPSLRASGFRLAFDGPVWTPEVRRMLRLTVPVALASFTFAVMTSPMRA